MYTASRESIAALVNPEPTASKRVRAAQARMRQRKLLSAGDDPIVLPALDIKRMQDQYHPQHGNKPRILTGTFRLPLHCPRPLVERAAKNAVTKFVQAMDKQGYDLVSGASMRVFPGMYPARDLLSGAALLDEREFMVQGSFRYRAPKLIRTEIPPHWREPLVLVPGGRGKG